MRSSSAGCLSAGTATVSLATTTGAKDTIIVQSLVIGLVVYVVPARVPPHVPPTLAMAYPMLGVIKNESVDPASATKVVMGVIVPFASGVKGATVTLVACDPVHNLLHGVEFVS